MESEPSPKPLPANEIELSMEAMELAGTTGVFTFPEMAAFRMDIFHALRNNDDVVYSLRDKENNLKGIVQYGIPDDVEDNRIMMIHWIVVGKKYQKNGVGLELVEQVEKDAIKWGAKMIVLETSSTKPYLDTRRFYDRLGFIPEATINDYYKPGDSKITYVKRL